MSCLNTCHSFGYIPLCEDILEFALPIFYANRAIEINITGRSNRIYKLSVTANENAIVSLIVSDLPNGYFSQYTVGEYKIWFVDVVNDDVIEFEEVDNFCAVFKFKDIKWAVTE